MTTFPLAPLRIGFEMYAGGDWRSIPGDVFAANGIHISRGLNDEQPNIAPSSMTATLDNTSGNYDPRNPVGAYYGSLGRGTPVRCLVTTEADTFARTVSNGWGTSSEGDAWGAWVSGGPTASAFAVSGGTATHSISATNAFCLSNTTNAYLNVEVQVDCVVLPAASVDGGNVQAASIVLRGQTISGSLQYYLVLVEVTTGPGNPVAVTIMDHNSTVIAATKTLTVTRDANAAIRVKAQAEGGTIRAKVWTPSSAEPAGWDIHGNPVSVGATYINNDVPGWVGIRSGVDSSNTNTTPIVFTYTNFVVRSMRYAGYIASLVPARDKSGKYRYATLTAASSLRRLGTGAKPKPSTLRQVLPTLSNLAAYWSCEDGNLSTSIADSTVGGRNGPMSLVNLPSFASDSSFVGSSPLPTFSNAYAFGRIAPYSTGSGTVQVRFLCHVPSTGGTDGMVLCRFWTTGSITRWDLVYRTGGKLELFGFNSAGTVIFDSTAVSFGMDGSLFRVGVQLVQSGSNINFTVNTILQGANGGGFSGTITGQSIGIAQALAINSGQNLNGTTIGHITVEANATNLFDVVAQFNAYAGESAASRMVRIGAGGDTLDYYADSHAQSIFLGPQPIDTTLNILKDAMQTDQGLLFEWRGVTGICYKTGGAHNAPGLRHTFNYANGELTEVIIPTDDDQNLHNDITAQRTGGGQVELALTTGPLSTLPPEQGGVGTYDQLLPVNPSTDARLYDIANWNLNIGTVNQARIPQITVNLANPRLAVITNLISVADIDIDTLVAVSGYTYDTVSLLVRGYTETLNAFEWQLSFNCAPGAPYNSLVFADVANPTATDCRLDTAGSTLNSTLTTTATSVSVAFTGARWTTNAADLPFDINIEGERMTVTAVSGTTSPQTFTVTRSVNGVVKAHNTTGVPVNIWSPCNIGFGRT